MKRALLLLSALGLVLGCQRPEVEAFRQHPVPIVVRMDVPSSLPGAEAIRREYEAALRSRLATRATVVVDGAVPPPASAELLVAIQDIRPAYRDATPAAVGVAAGVAVGTLSALAGNRDAVFDGLWWGLWAGSNAAAERRAERYQLGFRPNRISAVVYLRQADPAAPGRSIDLAEFDLGGYEVADAMMPLSSAERDEPGRIREEEARALARVIVRRLEERFGWVPRQRQDFYGLRPAPEPGPEGEAKRPADPHS